MYKAEKVDGHRVQRIKIIYNSIGEFTFPDTPTYEKGHSRYKNDYSEFFKDCRIPKPTH